MGKKTAYAVLISTACGIAYAIHVSLLAGAIGAGYAAKQICSGVFVARLPEQFVVDTDVLPRLATVGPLAQLLDHELDTNKRQVAAQMLGQTVTAQHSPRYGCTLGEAGEAPLFPFSDASPEIRNELDATTVASAKPSLTSQGWESAALQSALGSALDAAFAEPHEGGRNTLAVIVMHRGQIVAERYGAPVTADTPMQGWSMNKSLMATFIGRQIDQGHVQLSDSVLNALQAAGAGDATVAKVNPDLTLRHLLSMTTGFDFSERYFPGDDVTDMLYRQP
jgi:CubicO group peptidase (beta-lactamase class C family)